MAFIALQTKTELPDKCRRLRNFIFDYLGHMDLEVPQRISDPLETLRKLATVWDLVEDFAGGFVDYSLKFIEEARAAEAEDVTSEWHDDLEPRPWTLPLPDSEIHRVKRALWRIELFAAFFHEPYTFGVDFVPQSFVSGNPNAPLAYPIRCS